MSVSVIVKSQLCSSSVFCTSTKTSDLLQSITHKGNHDILILKPPQHCLSTLPNLKQHALVQTCRSNGCFGARASQARSIITSMPFSIRVFAKHKKLQHIHHTKVTCPCAAGIPLQDSWSILILHAIHKRKDLQQLAFMPWCNILIPFFHHAKKVLLLWCSYNIGCNQRTTSSDHYHSQQHVIDYKVFPNNNYFVISICRIIIIW